MPRPKGSVVVPARGEGGDYRRGGTTVIGQPNGDEARDVDDVTAGSAGPVGSAGLVGSGEDTVPDGVPPFVDAAWVQARPGVVLADVRWSLDGSEGRDTYLEGHLPGAVFVDLETVLSAAPGPSVGRHPLPSPDRFARDLGELGIGADEVVVAYDQGGGTVAARLVWMLRAIGQSAAVLDGGLPTWPEQDLAVGEVVREPVHRHPVPWPSDLVVDADQVDRRRERSGTVVLDAREPARYRGEHEPIDARPGHVPGARNLPTSANLAEGRLADPDTLRRRYAAVRAFEADEVIAYCGSGVTACHDLLVLEHLGVRGKLFEGSWSAWAADPARPAATGERPTP